MKPGIWELLILLVIILLLFGTKKLRNAGGDIGSAFKNFKKAVKDEDKADAKNVEDQSKDADFDSNRPQQEKAEQGSADNSQDKKS